MRPRTVAVVGCLAVLLIGVVVLALGGLSSGVSLDEAWTSDTPRDNEVNHHAVGVGPTGRVIVAPVAEVPYSDAPITDTSCALVRLAPSDGTVVWRAGTPAEDCFTHALTEPAIADIDGDGRSEVAVSSTENALIVYDARTGTEQWRVGVGTYGYGRPTVADLDGDGASEVVTSDIDGNVVAANHDGSVAWRAAINGTVDRPVVWVAPLVDDVDADGGAEVVVGSDDGAVVLTADGAVEWASDDDASYLAAAQVDADPAVELFAAGTGAIRAYDGSSGATEWTRNIEAGRIRESADGDGDGVSELYVGRADGTVLALDGRSGDTEWSTTVAGDDRVVVAPPVLGDVTGDGRPEVVAATKAGEVVVLDAASGAELSRYERTVPIHTFPTVADIDGDDRAEILVRYGDGRVVAVDVTADANEWRSFLVVR